VSEIIFFLHEPRKRSNSICLFFQKSFCLLFSSGWKQWEQEKPSCRDI
jgi:hypothetical protein